MQTEILTTSNILRGGEIIKSGGLLAVPTETVYGLAGNGLSHDAISRIYEVKGRPSIKPISLMVASRDDISKYCVNVPDAAYALADKFWPGPLTIVLTASPLVPEILRAGGKTVGLRCPDSQAVRDIISSTGIPLAAPSANISDMPSPKTAEEVLSALDGKIEGIIDGGECGFGLESTIIDMSAPPYRILRPGVISDEEVFDALADSMTIIGITGGSGSGKTTALKVIENMGGLTIDCDAVYHEMLRENGEMNNELLESFPGIEGDDGIELKKLGKIVFSDKQALEKLNSITHKHITKRISRLMRDWAAKGGSLVGIDAIALIEAGISEKCSLVLGVLAPEESRVSRIVKREGISKEYALLRIKAQKPDEFFRRSCDFILENSGDEEEFVKSCRELFNNVIKNKI